MTASTLTKGQPALGLGFPVYTTSVGKNSNKRPVGHQHWMLSPWKNASLTGNPEVANVFNDDCISGGVMTTDWVSLEPTQGLFTLNWVGLQLDTALARGKQIIIRIFAKTYSGPFADVLGAPPLTSVLPADIPLDCTTYGGLPGRGGLYTVYMGGKAAGWGASFENPNVRARFKALLLAIYNQFGSHPALKGIMAPDESCRSAWNGTGLPLGMSADTVAAANRDIYAYTAGLFGAARTYPVINSVDGFDPLFTTLQNTSNLQTWATGSGMSLGVSDLFVTADWHLQPAYFNLPRLDLQAGRQLAVHCDLMSLGEDDSTLNDRMVGMAKQSYWLMGGNAGITAWNPKPTSAGGSPNYWLAQKYAIGLAL